MGTLAAGMLDAIGVLLVVSFFESEGAVMLDSKIATQGGNYSSGVAQLVKSAHPDYVSRLGIQQTLAVMSCGLTANRMEYPDSIELSAPYFIALARTAKGRTVDMH